VAAAVDPRPHRIPFSLERVMRTDYRIDACQDTSFIIEGFGQLLEDTAPDFAPIYARLRTLPTLAPR
jgi:phenylalanine-4-hydroxylase